MQQTEQIKDHGGWLKRFVHTSQCCQCDMTFSVFLPAQADTQKVPVLYYLSGLTCTDDNVRTKGGAQQFAAEHGIALVMPDTSPRGDDVPDAADRYDLGKGAGFYVNANCGWGHGCFGAYLGDDQDEWKNWDATELIASGAPCPPMLADQGGDDSFLADQLNTEKLKAACERAGLEATIRMQDGYDHSYHFISSFIGEHIAFHAKHLKA